MDRPIIESFLDSDLYKFTMGQFVWRRHRDVPVTYALTNRTAGVRLAELVDVGELREQLEHLRTLKPYPAENGYLMSIGFEREWLRWLRDEFQWPEFELSVKDGQFDLRFRGPWASTIWWETPALAIINQLYNEALMCRDGLNPETLRVNGEERLLRKLMALRTAGLRGQITEFGTRRRFSREWQQEALRLCLVQGGHVMAGTSNVWLANFYEIPARGTMAHELFMAYQGIYGQTDSGLRHSPRWLLAHWWQEYGQRLSVALTDNYGSDAFFRDFTADQAAMWKGLRQDSGDPVEFGDKAIDFYRRHRVDPNSKLVMFSDGLTADRIVRLEQRFRGHIGTAYGWGTNLTNDCGLPPLSLVIKLVEANGSPTVKLSDNLAKAIGPIEAVERVKRVFGYSNTDSEECVY